MKKVVCWGTFDLLHEGHLEFFKDAKRKGEFLYVLVIPDKAILENKGRTPVKAHRERIEDILKTGLADEVFPTPVNNQFEFIASLEPDVFVFGYDQQTPWEEELKKYLAEKGITPEYYVSKEFAGGIHTKHLRP